MVSALSDEYYAKLNELTYPVEEEWAKKKDAKGISATEVWIFVKKLLGK